jgi:putative proteasome-type protease
MTYCAVIIMREGRVMASDSRTNASLDEVNVCQKMHTIVDPGECVFILLTSGNRSCSQSILTLLRRDFDPGKGLASASSMGDAARIVSEQVRTRKGVGNEWHLVKV